MKNINLNDNELKVLTYLAEGYDTSGWDETGFYCFKPIEKHTGLDRKAVRRACRSLTRKGFAKYQNALWGEDGPAGAGYGATELGAAYLNPCGCGELAIYDWWEDSKGIVVIPQLVNPPETCTNIKLCEKCYEDRKKLKN